MAILYYTEEDNTLKKLCEFIREYYVERLPLKQISEVAGLSPFYFQRLFLEKTGVSPHDFLLKVRIGNTKRFLSEGQSIVYAAMAQDTGP